MKRKNKLKVYVYAIAKNESKFVDRWVDSMSEADGIYVLVDGTTTDNTAELLKKRKVHVEKKIIAPWRFDTARNESLKLVPKDADVCVCTDLDEILSHGWRDIVEQNWVKGETNQGLYKIWYNAEAKNETPNIANCLKMHDRNSFYWKWSIHEYIVQKDPDQKLNVVNLEGILLSHCPDLTKPRNYKKLLQEAVENDPDDIRYQQLLAEEYLNSNEFEEAKVIINNLIQNPKSVHPYDIAISYKMLCLLTEKKGDFEKLRSSCYQALAKVSDCRWFYAELGDVLINQFKDFSLGIAMMEKALSIRNIVITARETEWQNEARIYCDLSIAYFYLKNYNKAIECIDLALEKNVNPSFVDTYLANKKIYEDALNNHK